MEPVSFDLRADSQDIDIERVARLLVRWHGPHAARRARWRAQELRKSDDMSGYVLWLAIEGTIDFRRRAARGQPEPSTAACPGATSGIEPRAVAPKPSPVAVFVRLIA